VPKATALNVAVTANTSQFDAQMAKVRSQLKATQKASSAVGSATGMASPLTGRLGGFAALAGLTGPMLGLSAALGVLNKSINAANARSEAGRKAFDEIVAGRMTPVEQARFSKVARIAAGDTGSAVDVASMLSAARPTTMEAEQKLLNAGMTQADLAAIAGASDTEALKLLVQLSRSPAGLEIAKALGGGAGTMFASLAKVADVSNIERAMRSGADMPLVQQAAAAEVARQTQVNATGIDFFEALGKLFTGGGFAPTAGMAAAPAGVAAAEAARANELLGEIANNTRGPG
jgi:hypothetical protein